MLERVAIVGIGYTPLRSMTPEVSYRELIFEAAVKAYADAGIEPQDADTFVSVTEDYTEGTAIADEYVPDQLGAVLKPVHTVTSDGITGIASLVMQLETEQLDVAVIEGHRQSVQHRIPSAHRGLRSRPDIRQAIGVPPELCCGPGDAGCSWRKRAIPKNRLRWWLSRTGEMR